MGYGQIDKFLVVGVFAGDAGLGRYGRYFGVGIKLVQHGLRADLVVGQAFNNLRIGQHALQFFAHRDGGQPTPLALRQARHQRRGGSVTKHPNVEQDIGVQD